LAWGRDGYIYLYGGSANSYGIVRVREAGGPAEQVTTLDSIANEASHRFPVPLPNGKGLVFSVYYRGGEPDRRDIAVVDFQTGEHEILAHGMSATYAPTGHVLYATSDGTLWAVPFDEKRIRITGEAVPLLDGVRLKPTGWDLSLSGSGTLIYTSGGASVSAPYGIGSPVWVDRQGRVSPVDPDWTFNMPRNNSLVLSPDGTRLAIDILDETADIWIKQLDNGPLMRLTFEATQHGVCWSPDGRTIAFSSTRLGDVDLFQKPADGTGNVELLIDADDTIGDTHWSRDGQWLLFRTGRTRDIWGFRPGVDSAPAPLLQSQYELMHPSLSPDGRWLLYSSNESGRRETYVRPFPEVEKGRWQVSTTGGTEPLWAHSGREIFYIDGQGQMVAVAVTTSPVFAIRESEVLFDPSPWRAAGVGWRTYYDVTPDDQRFIMVRDVGRPEPVEVILVENFFEELKQKVGNGND
jgi:Tol biopolymer transport system component